MTKFACANGDREILFLFVPLTTCRIGDLTRLIFTLACDDQTYIRTTVLLRTLKRFWFTAYLYYCITTYQVLRINKRFWFTACLYKCMITYIYTFLVYSLSVQLYYYIHASWAGEELLTMVISPRRVDFYSKIWTTKFET